MKDNRKTEIKVGVMTLVGVIVFLFVLGWAKDIDFSENKVIVNVSFPNVAGLSEGDAVMLNGVKKGKVDQITSSGKKVLVRLILDENTQIYDDATFSIMMLDLMGGKKVEISPGSKDSFDPGKIYEGMFLGDISTAMAMLSSVQEDLVAMTKDIRITLESTNKILGDEEFIINLKQSVKRLNEFSEKLNRFIAANENNFDTLLTNTNKLVSQTGDFLDNNKEQFSKLLLLSGDLINDSDSLVNRFRSFMTSMEKRENNLGKIVYDPQLYEDLKIMMQQVKEMTSLINEQLKGEGLKVDADVDLF